MTTVRDCIQLVSKHYRFRPIEVVSDRRQARLVRARHVAFWLAKMATPYSYPNIARRFGRRDHTTILHGIQRVEQLRAEDAAFLSETDTLLAMLPAGCEAEE